MRNAFSDALKTRILILGATVFATGLVSVAWLPPTPATEISRGGAIFAAE